MPDGFSYEIDFTEFNTRINKLYNMGEVRKRDITAIFRKADSPLVRAAKAGAKTSSGGVKYSRYKSRVHGPGNLKRGIKFATSKKQKFVYYVISKAWYSNIHIIGSKGGELGRARAKRGGYYNVVPKPKAAFIPGFGWAKKWSGFSGNPFMERARVSTEATVIAGIRNGMGTLTQKVWQNG